MLRIPAQLTKGLLSTALGLCALIFICLKIWYEKTPNINWTVALMGWSPIDWVNHHNLEGNYLSDFPTGAQNYDKSFFMYIYRLADFFLGVSADVLMPNIILFEMTFLGIASVFFFRALIPASAPISAFVFAILVINSGSRSMELAGFGGPFFWGLYYNFADGMRLIAIALLLRRRYFAAAILFVFSVTTHPVMGVMGGIFALGCFVGVREKDDLSKVIRALAIFLVLAGGWWFYHLQNVDVVSIGIAPDTWVTFTKAFSSHFYPVANGLFTSDFERNLLPFIALLLLAIFYIYRIPLLVKSRNGIMLGCGLLLLTSFAGLAISHWSSSPGLIRLALTRACDMLILVSLAVVVAGLLSELENGRFIQAALAFGLLLAPFVGPALPIAYVILIIIMQLPILQPSAFKRNEIVSLVLTISFGIFLFVYYMMGYVHLDRETIYFGHKQLWLLTLYVAAGVLVADLLRPVSRILRQVCMIAVLVVLFSKALYWRGSENFGAQEKLMGQAYLSTQLWAKDNTDPKALFLVDPTIYYGWRDFSQRSSFGNMREWLHTSWLYDPNTKNYEEGLRRAAEFGYHPPAYLSESPPLNGFSKIHAMVGDCFYSSDSVWFVNLAKKYSINYIVMKKERIKQRLMMQVAFENEYFVVYELPAIKRETASELVRSNK